MQRKHCKIRSRGLTAELRDLGVGVHTTRGAVGRNQPTTDQHDDLSTRDRRQPPDQAAQAAQKLGIPFDTVLCQEASRIDLADNSFDLIICSRVLQHVYNWRESVAEFARILKPGGDLVLLTYNRLSIYGLKKYYQHKFQNPTKGRFQNPVSLAKELKKDGLVINYFAGGLMGQPDLFSKDLSPSSRDFIYMLEKLAAVSPIKYLGSRLIIRAGKPALH